MRRFFSLLFECFISVSLIFLQSNKCLSQFDSSQNVFYLNKLSPEGILLDKGWKFQAGDNPDYAKPDYDDSKWQPINPTLDIYDSSLQIPTSGIGWLRLHLSIDSSLQKEQLALIINQVVASEIYLNGQLLYQFGVVGADPNKIKAYDPMGKPVSFPWDKSVRQVLAVRYAPQPNLLYTTILRTNPMLQIHMNKIDTAFDQYRYERGFITSAVFRIGVTLIFAILHLAFFLYYPQQKANLYFCLYAVFGLASDLADWNRPHMVEYLFYSFNLSIDTGQLQIFFLLTSLYSLFQQKRGWIYWGLLAATIAGIFLNGWGYPSHWLVSFYFIDTLVIIEVLRLVFKALKLKKRGAWIIALGAISSTVFWIVFVLGTIFNFMNIPISSNYIVFDLIFNLFYLSIPIATSIYLGLDFAFTTRTLQQKLTEVEELSQKTMAQEKEKQQILSSQKETLENQVQERTGELKQSFEHLKSTQAQLIQSEKMASLGELTAGIAHEIQNPLNFVNNFSEVNTELIDELKTELSTGNQQQAIEIANDIKDNEQKIIHHGKRADAIVKGMLQHSRTSTGQKELTDINALADEYLRLSFHGMRAKDKSFNATLQTDFDASIGKINIVPPDIGRVLLNLFNNAFYAVKPPNPLKGGTLRTYSYSQYQKNW